MCILCVSVLQNKRYPFILLDNREEEARPTTDAGTHFGEIYCAVDKLAGGTWCGLNKRTGVFAVLTNGPTPNKGADSDSDSDHEDEEPAYTSRGILVRGILESKAFVPDQPAEEVWREELGRIGGGGEFRGYNLVFGNLFGRESWAVYTTNFEGLEALSAFPCGGDPSCSLPLKAGSTLLKPQPDGSGGTFCVSNSHMNDWTWPKVKWLAEQTDQAAKESGGKDPSELNDVLSAILSANNLNFPDSSHPPCVLRPHNKVREEQLRTRQRNPFILETEGADHRTQQQTILVVEALGPDANVPARVHYFYRDCQAERPTKSDWDSTPWTSATFPEVE